MFCKGTQAPQKKGDSNFGTENVQHVHQLLMPQIKETGVTAKGLRRQSEETPICQSPDNFIGEENNCNE